VHDISYVHYPEFFSQRDLRLLSAYVPYSLRVARRVLTLSESAARDIERVYRVPREKIAVVPLAARSVFTQRREQSEVEAVRAKYGLAEPFFLAVGNLQPRKNLLRLVEAFARLPRELDGFKLVLVGKAQWQQSAVYNKVRSLGIGERVVFTGYVADEVLALLYRGALALVYPSLYEGFGLPVLEAMASGTPVICSNTSSMPEIAGDAAVLIDPLDTGALTEAMAAVAQDGADRQNLIARGYQRNTLYSWKQTALRTVGEYERALEPVTDRVTSRVSG
jgi:glycosyltransferase involved in cell wall biosynthesis